MIKDFQPYSNLWLTTSNWFKNSVHWLNDEWETLDAEGCERFVEDAFKTMGQVNRYFKDKDIPAITKIGETVRA
jgi:dynein heavy chain